MIFQILFRLSIFINNINLHVVVYTVFEIIFIDSNFGFNDFQLIIIWWKLGDMSTLVV